ncbi:MAG: hypothetical protein H0U76_06305 [Ktedonobacteraceae bacterium]|nr:hypothetical protein [Ktedonobacteraceae bacterium]
MKINAELAVVDDAQFVNAKLEKMALASPIANLGDLARQALEANVTYVWVMPGTQLSKGIERSFITSTGEEWDIFASYSRIDEDRPMFARIWRRKTAGRAGRTIYVGFPEYGTWPWKYSDVITLLATVSYIEQALGLPALWSPGRMALDLMKALNVEKRASWLSPLTLDLMALPAEDGTTVPLKKSARDLTWKRALTPKEKKMKWVHKYDKNSMYLAACTGILLGEGDPDQVSGNAYDDRLPGFWRVRTDRAESLYDGVKLPSPVRTQWMTTPVVQCCRKLGYQIEVMEGYQWRDPGCYHRTLESWANMLWAARRSLKASSPTFNQEYKHVQGRENAYATISAVAHVGVGKLGDDDTSGGLFRPDIWALVVGRSFANMLYNIETFRRAGFTPVLVYTDALWYISDDPNPETALPAIVDKQDKLGGYKVVYNPPLAMSKDVIDAFAKIDSPTKLVRRLNELAGEDDDLAGDEL